MYVYIYIHIYMYIYVCIHTYIFYIYIYNIYIYICMSSKASVHICRFQYRSTRAIEFGIFPAPRVAWTPAAPAFGVTKLQHSCVRGKGAIRVLSARAGLVLPELACSGVLEAIPVSKSAVLASAGVPRPYGAPPSPVLQV